MQARCALHLTQRRDCHRQLSDVAQSACPTLACRLTSRCSQRRFHCDDASPRSCPFDRNARRPATPPDGRRRFPTRTTSRDARPSRPPICNMAAGQPTVVQHRNGRLLCREIAPAGQLSSLRADDQPRSRPERRHPAALRRSTRPRIWLLGRWHLDKRSRHRSSAQAFATSKPHRQRLVENRRQCACRAVRASLLTAANMPTRRFHREAMHVHPGCRLNPVEVSRTPTP